MLFPVEIVLKGRDFAVTESVEIPHGEPRSWDDAAVRDVLVAMLRAIGRAENPDAPGDRAVVLQGFSWIVEPTSEGAVVVAIEIPMGAAVAGPFAIAQGDLDARIGRVIQAERRLLSTPDTIH
jgi:hypothetical protein